MCPVLLFPDPRSWAAVERGLIDKKKIHKLSNLPRDWKETETRRSSHLAERCCLKGIRALCDITEHTLVERQTNQKKYRGC